jgi:hypothetical protein
LRGKDAWAALTYSISETALGTAGLPE